MSKGMMNGSDERRSIKSIMKAIRANRRFLVSSHVNPEGDALGSAIALSSLLKRLGKQVILANDGGIPEAFRFLPRVTTVIGRPSDKVSADVSMIVDVPTISRIGSIQKIVKRVPLVINIDHHVSNQRFADINWVDPKAASVGEMIYRLYRAYGFKPSKEEALCIYVSLVTDTGSFKYMNTTSEVHRIAAEMIAAGISPLKVSQQLYETHSVSDLRFLGMVLKGLRQTPDGQVAWLEVPLKLMKSAKAGPEVLDELVNYPRSVRSAEVAFVIKEAKEPGKIRVSFRSKGNVDVDQVARRFGGGGHIAASGCTLEKSTIPQARNRVLKVVREALKKRKV